MHTHALTTHRLVILIHDSFYFHLAMSMLCSNNAFIMLTIGYRNVSLRNLLEAGYEATNDSLELLRGRQFVA